MGQRGFGGSKKPSMTVQMMRKAEIRGKNQVTGTYWPEAGARLLAQYEIVDGQQRFVVSGGGDEMSFDEWQQLQVDSQSA